MLKLVGFLLGFIGDALGLVAADALSSTVTLSGSAVLIVAAALAVIQRGYTSFAVRVIRRAGEGRSCLFNAGAILLMFGGVFLALPLLVLGAHLVPGFDVHSPWGYPLAFVCAYGASCLVVTPLALVKRVVTARNRRRGATGAG